MGVIKETCVGCVESAHTEQTLNIVVNQGSQIKVVWHVITVKVIMLTQIDKT